MDPGPGWRVVSRVVTICVGADQRDGMQVGWTVLIISLVWGRSRKTQR